MAIEHRKGKKYYYRKKRIGSKVISEYIGSGKLAEIASNLDKNQQQTTKAQKQLKREEQRLYNQFDVELLYLERTINELFTIAAIDNGYHKPKRQWRKKRQK